MLLCFQFSVVASAGVFHNQIVAGLWAEKPRSERALLTAAANISGPILEPPKVPVPEKGVGKHCHQPPISTQRSQNSGSAQAHQTLESLDLICFFVSEVICVLFTSQVGWKSQGVLKRKILMSTISNTGIYFH